jgi:elongation factor Ts
MSAISRFGVIAAYVHPGAQLGALVEVCCESRAASMSREVRELAHDLAVHVVATNPLVVCIEDLSPRMLAAAADNLRSDCLRAGRSEPFVLRVTEMGMERFHEQACLLEQKFVKDVSMTIHELLESRGAMLKEKLRVVRFARFSTNDPGAEEARA